MLCSKSVLNRYFHFPKGHFITQIHTHTSTKWKMENESQPFFCLWLKWKLWNNNSYSMYVSIHKCVSMTISRCRTVRVGVSVHVWRNYSIKITHFSLFLFSSFFIRLLNGFHLWNSSTCLHYTPYIHTYIMHTLRSSHAVIYVNQNDLIKNKIKHFKLKEEKKKKKRLGGKNNKITIIEMNGRMEVLLNSIQFKQCNILNVNKITRK